MPTLSIPSSNRRKMSRMADRSARLLSATVTMPMWHRPETVRVIQEDPIEWLDGKRTHAFVASNEFGPLFLIVADSWESAWEAYVDEYADGSEDADADEDSDENGNTLGYWSSSGHYLSESTVAYMRLDGIELSSVRFNFAGRR